MIKGLELINLYKKISTIPLSRGIRTDLFMLAKGRRGIPTRNPDEPGIRRRRTLFQNDDEDIREQVENEGDLENEVDVMNIDRAYDLNEREKVRNKRNLEYMITAKKFFAPRTQPPMLTCNERECIRHLHKEDPVQWNIKTLSESFPATPDIIKKIIKAKWKITPERAKIIDGIVQKNWELLAEGKLDADPQILEHFKRFINRREVLLEQLKNREFYLPEVKKERVWNSGEFSGVLRKYEKDVEQLVKETGMGQQPKMLKDGTEKSDEEEGNSSLELVHAKIDNAASRLSLENKDSFMFSEMTKFYSKHTTLEDLEDTILKRADAKKKLDVVDQAILETRFGLKSEKNVENSPETGSPPSVGIQKNMKESLGMESKRPMRCDSNDEFVMSGSENFSRIKSEEEEMESKNLGRNRRFSGIRPEEDEEMEFGNMDRNRRFNRMRREEDEEMESKNMGRNRRFNRMRPEEDEEMEFGNMDRNRRFNRMRREEDEEMESKNLGRNRKFNRMRPEEEMELNAEVVPSDERTLTATETNIGELLENLQNPPQPKKDTTTEHEKKAEEKPKIDFSDPERLKRENIYYDNEVKDIENTAFWNSGRSSKEKALAEQEKLPHEGPDYAKQYSNPSSTAFLSQDPYPERIKIPRDKQRSGLIFKVKDCYYDDDGEFLYRVPGMTK